MGRSRLEQIASGENRIGKVSSDLARFSLTFSTDTSAYASGDLVADTQEIASFFPNPNAFCEVECATLIDQAAQTASAYSLVFMLTSTSLGTENSAPSITDANWLLGFPRLLPIATTDWQAGGTANIAQVRNAGLILRGGGSTTSIYVGLLNGAGTPTFAAASLKLELMVRRHSGA